MDINIDNGTSKVIYNFCVYMVESHPVYLVTIIVVLGLIWQLPKFIRPKGIVLNVHGNFNINEYEKNPEKIKEYQRKLNSESNDNPLSTNNITISNNNAPTLVNIDSQDTKQNIY